MILKFLDGLKTLACGTIFTPSLLNCFRNIRQSHALIKQIGISTFCRPRRKHGDGKKGGPSINTLHYGKFLLNKMSMDKSGRIRVLSSLLI